MPVASQPEGRERQLELPLLIALALGGALLAIGVVSVNGIGPDALTQLGEFRLWLFLIAAQTALWTIGAAVLVAPQVRTTLEGVWSGSRRVVLTSVAVAAVPLYGFTVFASLGSNIDYPLPDHRWKILALTTIGTAVALVGFAEFALVKVALEKHSADGTRADIDRYLELRALLQRVLAVEGAILGAAILASGALRNTVIAYTTSQSSYPREYVLVLGAYFTLLLALLYTPVYIKLLAVGQANLDAACPQQEPASQGWLEAYEKRNALAEHLQLGVTASASFRAGIAILAPLASALVALLLGT